MPFLQKGYKRSHNVITLGSDCKAPEDWVVMVRTVVMPRATLAGEASADMKNDTHDKMTMSMLGM